MSTLFGGEKTQIDKDLQDEVESLGMIADRNCPTGIICLDEESNINASNFSAREILIMYCGITTLEEADEYFQCLIYRIHSDPKLKSTLILKHSRELPVISEHCSIFATQIMIGHEAKTIILLLPPETSPVENDEESRVKAIISWMMMFLGQKASAVKLTDTVEYSPLHRALKWQLLTIMRELEYNNISTINKLLGRVDQPDSELTAQRLSNQLRHQVPSPPQLIPTSLVSDHKDKSEC